MQNIDYLKDPSFWQWLRRARPSTRFLVFVTPLLLIALGVLLGDLIADDIIPAPKEARDQLKGIKLGAKVLAAKLGESAANFDLDEYLSTIDSPSMRKFIESVNATFGESRLRPGLKWKMERNATAKHPIVLFPGFITTQLEIWEGLPCAKSRFHTTVWGGLSMIEFMLRDAECWAKHMTVDPLTGKDPSGIKLRPVDALHGIDYLFPGYWVFGKMIQNLADLGYDANTIYAATYDWRLNLQNAEERDNVLSKLKANIEIMVARTKQKAVILPHSMGGPNCFYFLKWVEHLDPAWIDKHIQAVVNLGGAMLGVPKALAAWTSGEMKDTAEFELLRAYIADNFISPETRLSMFRSWYSLATLLPKGGDAVWGDSKSSPEESPNVNGHHFVFSFRNGTNFTVTQALEFMKDQHRAHGEGHEFIPDNLIKWNSLGHVDPKSGFKTNGDFENDRKYWTNPLESPLPFAPNLNIYCFYGVGKPSERSYYYRDQAAETASSWSNPDLQGIRYSIDTALGSNGVRFGEGDGTVPLVSLGYLCARGWRHKLLNPSEIDVITREYRHDPSTFDLRGGEETADHVDMMGNYDLISDVLAIATGAQDAEKDIIHSDILRISKDIDRRIGFSDD